MSDYEKSSNFQSFSSDVDFSYSKEDKSRRYFTSGSEIRKGIIITP